MMMKHAHRFFRRARRDERLEVFKADPPATKIHALLIIERGETMRHAIRLLLAVTTGILLNYSPALVSLLRVAF